MKCEFFRFSPAETSTIKTPCSEIYINIPREDSVTFLLNSYLKLNLEVIKKAAESRHTNGNDIYMVLLGPIAFFSKFKLTTSCGKHLEDISHVHLVPLMYSLLISSSGSDDLSNGFHRDRNRR